MELTWIDDFLALVDTRNFTRAAEMRHTTQSAYSRRIARLEEWLGTQLFLRSTRPVELTPQGQEFLARAKLIKSDIMDTQRAVQVLDSHFTHPARIYTTNTLAVGFLPQFMSRLKDYFDERPVTLLVASVTGCRDALNAGKADAIIIPDFHDDKTQIHSIAEKVGTDSLSLMATKNLAKQIQIQKKQIIGAVMMYPPSVRYGQIAEGILSAHKLTLHAPPVCESASAESLVALAKYGFGAAFVPKILGDVAGLIDCLPALKEDYDIVLIRKGIK